MKWKDYWWEYSIQCCLLDIWLFKYGYSFFFLKWIPEYLRWYQRIRCIPFYCFVLFSEEILWLQWKRWDCKWTVNDWRAVWKRAITERRGAVRRLWSGRGTQLEALSLYVMECYWSSLKDCNACHLLCSQVYVFLLKTVLLTILMTAFSPHTCISCKGTCRVIGLFVSVCQQKISAL